MSLFIRVVTGWRCSCGNYYSSDQADSLIKHLITNPTHTTTEIIQSVPTTTGTILIVIGACLIMGFFMFILKKENDSNISSIKTSSSNLIEANNPSSDYSPSDITAYEDRTKKTVTLETAILEEYNDSEKIKSLKREISTGNQESITELARMYVFGIDTEKDVEKGIVLLKKAGFKNEHKLIWYEAGICYLEGNGVEKSIGKAVKYLNNSARYGYPPAKSKLKELEEQGIDTYCSIW